MSAYFVYRESDASSLLFVRFVITNYFAIRNLSLFWYVCNFQKETCVGSWDVADALKKAACLVAEFPLPKGLEVRVIHEGHVFHLLAGYWMDDCVFKILLGPRICSEGNGYVSVSKFRKSFCDKFLGKYFVSASTPSERLPDLALV
jgi:hypothetical protein